MQLKVKSFYFWPTVPRSSKDVSPSHFSHWDIIEKGRRWSFLKLLESIRCHIYICISTVWITKLPFVLIFDIEYFLHWTCQYSNLSLCDACILYSKLDSLKGKVFKCPIHTLFCSVAGKIGWVWHWLDQTFLPSSSTFTLLLFLKWITPLTLQ